MNITKISKYLSNIRNINHVRCFASEVSKTETAEELIQNAATAIDENGKRLCPDGRSTYVNLADLEQTFVYAIWYLGSQKLLFALSFKL